MKKRQTIKRTAALAAAVSLGSLGAVRADDAANKITTLEIESAEPIELELESTEVPVEIVEGDDVVEQLKQLIERLEFSDDNTRKRRVIVKKSTNGAEAEIEDLDDVFDGAGELNIHKLLHYSPGNDPNFPNSDLNLQWSDQMMMMGPDGQLKWINPGGLPQPGFEPKDMALFPGDSFEYRLVPGATEQVAPSSPYYIGVVVTEAPEAVKEFLGLNKNVGVIVEETVEDAPAAKAGLKKGDIIVKANGEYVGNRAGLVVAIEKAGDGELDLEINRMGSTQSIKLKAAKRETPKIVSPPFVPNVSPGQFVWPHDSPGANRVFPSAGEIKALRTEVKENRKLLERILKRLDELEDDY